jgi:hypothetical protein
MKNLRSVVGRTDSRSAERLLRIWAERYLPDASYFLLSEQISTAELTQAASLQGRTETAAKLKRLAYFYSKLAWLRTSELLSEDPNVANLAEIRFLAQFLSQVFEKILEVYTWKQPPIPLIKSFEFSHSAQKGAVLTQDLPAIYQLAEEFKPVLAQLHQQHVLADNPDILGFMTTQFHFSTEELLKRVSPAEQLLLSPYFKFAEEQLCIPWQQIAAATYRHGADSPTLGFVETTLASSGAIAEAVYEQLLETFPSYESRRGKLTQAGVKASIVRDTVMFQAYLCLCLLEDSLTSVEEKLLPLCRTVFPRVGVRPAFVRQALYLLVDEIQIRFPSEDSTLFSRYARQLVALFAEE